MTKLSRCQPHLGCYVEITIEADGSFDRLAELSNIGFKAIAKISKLLSYHSTDSELTEINKNAHKKAIPLSNHTHKIISFSLTLAEQSQGLFDPTIAPQLEKLGLLPNHHQTKQDKRANWRDIHLSVHTIRFHKPLTIDLGGVAKGYAVDYAIESILAEDPQAQLIINAGGDIRMTHWQDQSIQLQSPQKKALPISAKMQAASVATTSYIYTQKTIIDPNKRTDQTLKQSISVFHTSCMVADALTKVIALNPKSPLCYNYGACALSINQNSILSTHG